MMKNHPNHVVIHTRVGNFLIQEAACESFQLHGRALQTHLDNRCGSDVLQDKISIALKQVE